MESSSLLVCLFVGNSIHQSGAKGGPRAGSCFTVGTVCGDENVKRIGSVLGSFQRVGSSEQSGRQRYYLT